MLFAVETLIFEDRAAAFVAAGRDTRLEGVVRGRRLVLSNAFESVRYDEGGFQLNLCELCGYPGCLDGSWCVLRKVGDFAVVAPAADLLRHDLDMAFYYEAPDFIFRLEGAPAITRAQYLSLRVLNATLPDWPSIEPLRSLEALVLHQITAPSRVLGSHAAPASVKSESFLAVEQGDLDKARADLEAVAAQAERGGDAPLFFEPDQVVTFILDLPNYPLWSPLAYQDGAPGLYVGPPRRAGDR